MTTMARAITDTVQAHAAVCELYHGAIKPHVRDGGMGVLTWTTADPTRRHQQRKHFHGPVLKAISEQVALFDPTAGKPQRYAKAAWKVLLARQFLAPQFDAFGAEVDPPSTEHPTDDEFVLFLHEVQAWAATEWNVVIPEQEVPIMATRPTAPAPKPRKRRQATQTMPVMRRVTPKGMAWCGLCKAFADEEGGERTRHGFFFCREHRK